jgi:hypothetical protein
MLITCKNCRKEFRVFPSRLKLGMVKYCSQQCYRREGEANPFHGKKHNITSIKKMTNHPNRPRFKPGQENPNYSKPEGKSYAAIHRKVNREFNKSIACDHCEEQKKLEWANISGKYIFDRSDWLCLCRSCHKKFDNNSKRPGRKDFIT